MTQREITKQIYVKGMVCNGCELEIEKKVKTIDGIIKVTANFANGTVIVIFDENKTTLTKIKTAITSINYEVLKSDTPTDTAKLYNGRELAMIAIIIFGIFIILQHLGFMQIFNYFPEAKAGMSYAAIFIIGMLTSVHCVGMCGGICLSQCSTNYRYTTNNNNKLAKIRPSLLYNLGRVTSYTIIGGIVGALGKIISFGGIFRGVVALLAGVFMIIMGLNMLNLFPWLKKFNLHMPKFIVGNIQGKNNGPFIVGLINGFMPCGPLQAMQLYALSTGDPIKGAISMFLFSIGTVPLMFSFGALSSLLSKKFTAKMMSASAVLIIILGFGMFNTGLNMSGFLAIGTEKSTTIDFQPEIVNGYQIIEIEVSPRGYAPITVKKDIPVKFNIHAEAGNLNGCNNTIMIPEYNLTVPLQEGDNIIEFTPDKTGTIPYSCWMNMIRSSITVVE